MRRSIRQRLRPGFPLLLIVAAFVVAIVAVARWRGVRALLGLGIAFGVLVVFTLPALLDGNLPCRLPSSGAAILFAVLYLAHGVNLRTSSALLGTLASCSSRRCSRDRDPDDAPDRSLGASRTRDVQAYIQHVSITGLLLAGFIIGSLGVLNDVTITQASAAFEIASMANRHATNHLRVGDAGRTRPHREYRLHARARVPGARSPCYCSSACRRLDGGRADG